MGGRHVAVNRQRGEVGAVIDGRERVLCLTLGALAELEDAFAAEDVGALVQRFGSGRLSARDLIRIVGAGLRGGGEDVTDSEVSAMRIEGGTAGAARIAAELLGAAFGEAEAEASGQAARTGDDGCGAVGRKPDGDPNVTGPGEVAANP